MAKKPVDNEPEKKEVAQAEALLREVDDAVREDDLRNFWQRYGILLTLVLVLGLGSLAGWIYYQNQLTEKAGARSEEMVAALDALKKNDLDGVVKELKPLETAEQDGYRATSKLMEANVAMEKGEVDKAVAGYKAVAEDESLPKPFRDLALIRQTASEYEKLKPQQIVDRLKPLASPGNPWFGSAGEMVAMAYMDMEKNDLAGPLFAQIAKDQAVPQSIRTRAVQMAGILGVDAVIQLDDKDLTEETGQNQTNGEGAAVQSAGGE